MNKKGGYQLGNFVIYLIYLIPVILVIFLGFFVVTGMLNSQITDTSSSLEPLTIFNRIIYSPNCFAYQDTATLRAYPFVIDIGKFDKDHLDNCISYHKGIRLTLSYENKEIYAVYNILHIYRIHLLKIL